MPTNAVVNLWGSEATTDGTVWTSNDRLVAEYLNIRASPGAVYLNRVYVVNMANAMAMLAARELNAQIVSYSVYEGGADETQDDKEKIY